MDSIFRKYNSLVANSKLNDKAFSPMKKNITIFCTLLVLLVIGYFFVENQKKSMATDNVKANLAMNDLEGPTRLSLPMEYKGVNLVAPINTLNKSTLEDLLKNNVNAVSIIPYAYVDMDAATVNYNNKRQWWGERTEGITTSAKMAHSHHMTVMLKPHLWVNHNFYTGNLNFDTEEQWQRWESQYEDYIMNFAKLAQQENIELFCFATELGNSVAKRPQYWKQLIAKIKKVYKGKLTYAANWDDYDKVPFWDELDYIGVDAYFPLSNEQNPSLKTVKNGWAKHLDKMRLVQKKFGKKIMFSEYGYRNTDFAVEAPWTENKNDINNEAQAIAYEALYQTMTKEPWFVGGFAWKWYADDYHKKPKNKVDYTPQDKPALAVIKKWYN